MNVLEQLMIGVHWNISVIWSQQLKQFCDDPIIFQNNTVPWPYTSKITKKWVKDNNNERLEWPPSSPDLNVIENVWALLKKTLPKQIEETGWSGGNNSKMLDWNVISVQQTPY